MAATNSNATVIKWNGTDISGFWTDELGHKRTANLIEANRGSNATHVQRLAALRDNDFTFMIFYGTTEAERVLSFNLIDDGDSGTLYYAPEGEIAGKQYFEGPMLVESVDGPKPKQDKQNMFVATITLKGNGTPTHELNAGVIT